ncbi:unnamed protein product [Anisakis simplex]|uniref:Transposase n=1 Tax=Anisakis simplex TaxID=6269 RepID=A0A0M3K089_ANISI|nr:unnamed protein product [Anisakis simplex]
MRTTRRGKNGKGVDLEADGRVDDHGLVLMAVLDESGVVLVDNGVVVESTEDSEGLNEVTVRVGGGVLGDFES